MNTNLNILYYTLQLHEYFVIDGNQLNKKKKSFQIMNGVFTIQSLSHSGTCRYILDIEILWFIFSPFFGFMHASTTVLV